MEKFEPWIGVDLDGTLAEHATGRFRKDYIGKAVPKMVERVHHWLAEGKQVKIFTARVAHSPAVAKKIKLWLMENGLPPLEVTNIKDPGMVKLYDDRAVQVEMNTGKTIVEDMDAKCI
jgi:hypothetical protein